LGGNPNQIPYRCCKAVPVYRDLYNVNITRSGTVYCKDIDMLGPAWPSRIEENFRDDQFS
jgi:hypothetical protein